MKLPRPLQALGRSASASALGVFVFNKLFSFTLSTIINLLTTRIRSGKCVIG